MPLILPVDEPNLEPVIIAMGTSRILRIQQVGAVYFVQGLKWKRSLGPDGKEVTEDEWTNVAIAKGKDARREAFEWLNEANIQVIKASLRRDAGGVTSADGDRVNGSALAH